MKIKPIFFFKTMQFLKTHGKDSLNWIYFFSISAYEGKKVGCINPAYIFVQAFIRCVLSISGKEYFTWWVLSSSFFKFLTPSPMLINQAYSGTKQVIEGSHSLGNSILSFVHTFANVSDLHLCRHPWGACLSSHHF